MILEIVALLLQQISFEIRETFQYIEPRSYTEFSYLKHTLLTTTG